MRLPTTSQSSLFPYSSFFFSLQRSLLPKYSSSSVQLHPRRTMSTGADQTGTDPTTNTNTTTLPIVNSPPTSPPSKRVKTAASPTIPTKLSNPISSDSISSTLVRMASSDNASAPVPALQIKKLDSSAKLPTRGSAFAAGYDIYASKATTIPARGKALVDTDIAIAVPAGTYGRIAPRSGLASKNFIDTGAGVIDADYRGQVKVLLFNHGPEDFPVAAGDRVAQLIIERIYTPEIEEVTELEESVRGAGGFGSTGTN